MPPRPSRQFRPGVSPLEGRLALSHAFPTSQGAAQLADAARHAAALGSFHGSLAGKVHTVYFLQPGKEQADASVVAAGRSPGLGRYAVNDLILADLDEYNEFMYGNPGVTHYQGILRFDDGPTLPVQWTVHAYRKDGAVKRFPIEIEGVVMSESGNQPIGDIEGQGHLTLTLADRFAQIYSLDARLHGHLTPAAAGGLPGGTAGPPS